MTKGYERNSTRCKTAPSQWQSWRPSTQTPACGGAAGGPRGATPTVGTAGRPPHPTCRQQAVPPEPTGTPQGAATLTAGLGPFSSRVPWTLTQAGPEASSPSPGQAGAGPGAAAGAPQPHGGSGGPGRGRAYNKQHRCHAGRAAGSQSLLPAITIQEIVLSHN